MKFRYQARNKEGELQVGFVESFSKEGAVNVLLSHELFVLSIDNAENIPWYKEISNLFNRVSLSDLMVFTRQFATLLESKVPLGDSLKNLFKQSNSPALKDIIYEISEDVDSGLALSQALEKKRGVFSEFYINMIRSAEITGRMEESMNYLAAYIEKQKLWRTRIINSLMYPAIIFVLFIGVIILISTMVLPNLKTVFDNSDVALPWYTTAIFGMGNFVTHWWWAVLAVLVPVLAYLVEYFRSEEGGVVLDELFLRMPVFGNLFLKMYVSRFADSLSVLIKGGVPIAQALQITAHSVGSRVYRDVLMEVSEDVRGGELLSTALQKNEYYFPPLVSQMTGIGEVTGRLDELLIRVARFYEREVDDVMSRMGELIQPIVMAVMGVFIGFLFAAILIPLYNLMQSIKI